MTDRDHNMKNNGNVGADDHSATNVVDTLQQLDDENRGGNQKNKSASKNEVPPLDSDLNATSDASKCQRCGNCTGQPTSSKKLSLMGGIKRMLNYPVGKAIGWVSGKNTLHDQVVNNSLQPLPATQNPPTCDRQCDCAENRKEEILPTSSQIYQVLLSKLLTKHKSIYITKTLFEAELAKLNSSITSSASSQLDLTGFKEDLKNQVFQHNANILHKNYGIENSKQLKEYIFEIGIFYHDKQPNLYDSRIASAALQVQNEDVFHGHEDIIEWVSKVFGPSKEMVDSLQDHFSKSLNIIWKDIESKSFHTVLQNSYFEQVFQTTGKSMRELDSKFEVVAKTGREFIVDFFKNAFKMLQIVERLRNELANTFDQLLSDVMEKILSRKLFRPEQLTKLYSEVVTSVLIPGYKSALRSIFDEQFETFLDSLGCARLAKISLSDPMCGRWMEMYEVSEKVKSDFWLSLWNDAYVKFSTTNKQNVKLMYQQSVKAVKKCNETFEASVSMANIDKSDILSFGNEEKAKRLHGLEKELRSMQYSFVMSHILEEFSKRCSSYVEYFYAQAKPSEKLNVPTVDSNAPGVMENSVKEIQEIPVSLSGQESCQESMNEIQECLIIDFNLHRIRVSSSKYNEDSTLSFELLPVWIVLSSGEVLIGESAHNINSRITGKSWYDCELVQIIYPGNLCKTYPSFNSGGETVAELTPVEIISQFISEFKRTVELKLGCCTDQAVFVLPLHLTMKQRWVIKQAAELGGFVQCTLMNDTTASAYEVWHGMEPEKDIYFLVTTIWNGLIDCGIYNVAQREDKSVVQMIHTFCNIPAETVPRSWSEAQEKHGKWAGLNKVIIDYLRRPHICKCDKPRRLNWCKVNLSNIDSPIFLDEGHDCDFGVPIPVMGAYRLQRNAQGTNILIVNECVSYPMAIVVNKKIVKLFPQHSMENEACINILGDSKFSVAESDVQTVLCRFEVKGFPNASRVTMRFSRDDNGLFKDLPIIDIDPRDFKKCQSQLQISFKWEKPHCNHGQILNLFPGHKEITTMSTELKIKVEDAKEFITTCEVVIGTVTSSVKQKFLLAAVNELRDEIASESCSEEGIQLKTRKLEDLLKKFGPT